MEELTLIGKIKQDASLKSNGSQFAIHFTVGVAAKEQVRGKWTDTVNWYPCTKWIATEDSAKKLAASLKGGLTVWVRGKPKIERYETKTKEVVYAIRCNTSELKFP